MNRIPINAEHSSPRMSATRFGGLVLVAGTILTVSGMLFRPGSLIVNPVENPFAFDLVTEALVSRPFVGHLTTEITVIGMVFVAYGLTGMWGIFSDGTAGNGIARLGIVLTATGYVALVFGDGLIHMMIHLSERPGQDAEILAVQSAAVQSMRTGTRLAGGLVCMVGNGFLGFGIFASMSSKIHKYMALGIGILAVAISALLGVIQHNLELASIYQFLVICGIPVPIWYVIIGTSMFVGKGGFALKSNTAE